MNWSLPAYVSSAFTVSSLNMPRMYFLTSTRRDRDGIEERRVSMSPRPRLKSAQTPTAAGRT